MKFLAESQRTTHWKVCLGSFDDFPCRELIFMHFFLSNKLFGKVMNSPTAKLHMVQETAVEQAPSSTF